MSGRFEGLNKIPQEPAARLLAGTNLKLEAELAGPATAGVADVLAELEAAGALVDMLKLLAASLPPRESAWWACLAGRDVIGPQAEPSPSLAAAEAWVFRPGEETRKAAFRAAEAADPMDDTAMCATIVVYADGTLGPDDLKEYPAPQGALQAMAFGINLKAVDAMGDDFDGPMNFVIDRALDIARGGNGRIARPTESSEESAG
ncbi:hypothetical protein R3X27_10405 [Tropicimonas sp. TH_r6]|uniref:DUF6931 family protein n=1 Tax=Tropicimonas sp. TH_r6 TaxID=3082085 RepID=UPI002954597A|nr:hypothetical protein [Tropicimonas sp. TH_r6]MDV7143094.1 hypothetical protein [Tropicimonas sp. TH_r6]